MVALPLSPTKHAVSLPGASDEEVGTQEHEHGWMRPVRPTLVAGLIIFAVIAVFQTAFQKNTSTWLKGKGLIGLSAVHDAERLRPSSEDVQKFLDLVKDDANIIETQVMLSKWTGLSRMMNSEGQCPLQIATSNCKHAAMTAGLLLEHAKERPGPASKFVAEAQDCASSPEMVRASAAQYASLNGGNDEALCKAVQSGNKDVVGELLKLGANAARSCATGSTALHLAAEMGHEHIARVLLGQGAPVDKHDAGDATPLMMAACQGDVAMMQLLLDQGASVNELSNGWSPIGGALLWGQLEAAKLLKEYHGICEPSEENYCIQFESQWN